MVHQKSSLLGHLIFVGLVASVGLNLKYKYLSNKVSISIS